MHPNFFASASGGLFRRSILLAACLAAGAHATTYTITSNTMGLTNDGVCGFREAIDAVNTGSARWGCPGPDGASAVINLSPNTYAAPAGLSLTRSVSIRCPSGACIIDIGSVHADLFTVSGANTPVVVMYRLTLRQPAANPYANAGVAVLAGTVNLDALTVTGFKGDGLSIQAGSDHTVLRSMFSGNGVGFNLWDRTALGSNSNTISNNMAGVVLGAVYGFNDDGSVISDNSQGGINFATSGGSMSLANTTIRGNRNRGISMSYSSEAMLNHCTIERNTTQGNGAGIYIPSNFTGATAFARIISSTISNNRAQGDGGGVYVTGTCDLTNSTLSNDTAAHGGGAYSSNNSTNSYLFFTHSTVAFNYATVSGGGVVNVAQAGNGRVDFTNSIIAKNAAPSHPDVSGPGTSRTSLFGDLTGYTGDQSADLDPADPLLGALVDNAGPARVKTHALLKGSPAINKVNPSQVLTTDERGFPRPTASMSWDVGAYEVMPFETELLTLISYQGLHETQTGAEFSNGSATVLRSAKVGDYATYAVAVPAAVSTGTPYDIAVRVKAGPDGGQVELATSPGTTDFHTLGQMDLYSPASQMKTFNLSFPFTSPGIKHFRLKIVGKNASSAGYSGVFDYISITNQ